MKREKRSDKRLMIFRNSRWEIHPILFLRGGGPFRKFLRILFLFEFWGNFLSFQGRRDGNARSKQGQGEVKARSK